MMSALEGRYFNVAGAGNIGRILLERLAAAGVQADHLAVCDSDPARGQAAADRLGIRAIPLTDGAAYTADAILIASPPPTVADVLQAIAGRLHPGQLVISFAAAVPLSRLEALVPPGVAVARIMPTAPSLVGQGMNLVAYGISATTETRALVEAILAALGQSIEVQDDQMAWCIGLAGAAMRSVLPGLESEIARRVAAQIMAGTAALALHTDLSLDEIKRLTPMQTLDEAAIADIFRTAAGQAREKIDQLQRKLEAGA